VSHTATTVQLAAQAMLPVLRERQDACETLGRLPDQTNDEFVAAGFYRILQPRRFGGCELDMPTFLETMASIARGCPSSGWVLALTAGHALLLAALFPEQGQIEIFGSDGEFRAPASLNGVGSATPIDAGYRLSGTWSYVSGISIATHFMGVASVPSTEQRLLVTVPDGAFSIVEDWDVLGMRGTGSHRVVVDDVFVPAHHTCSAAFDYASSHLAAGRGVHAAPIYRAGRIGSLLWGEMAAVAVGVAQGALDEYAHELRSKKLAYPPFSPRSEVPEFQRQFGQAWALVGMAEATLERIGRDYMTFAEHEVDSGEPFSDQRDRQLQLLEQYVTRLAADALDIMFRTAGTSATRSSARLQRYYRDMAMVRTHRAAQYENGAQEFGRGFFEES
jgi:3-hydroxy-9,10-secoandrosta-1,3,5(10)-triene-9,17-dione monooxygenase